MAWYKTPIFRGLITSATDMTLTMDSLRPNGFNATTVPGQGILEVTTITAANVGSVRYTVSIWMVESGGSIGDANKIVNAAAIMPNMTATLFNAGAGDGYLLTEGMSIHAMVSTANKVKLDISGRFDDSSGGQVVM